MNFKVWIGIILLLGLGSVAIAQRYFQLRAEPAPAPTAVETTEPPLDSAALVAQTQLAAQDLVRIRAAYEREIGSQCLLEYELTSPQYPGQVGKTTATLTQTRLKSHFQLSDIEYVREGEQLLSINHQTKTMLLNKTGKENTAFTQVSSIVQWLGETGAVPVVERESGSVKKMNLELLNPEVENMQLWYDTTHYRIQKVQLQLARFEEAAADTLRLSFKQEQLWTNKPVVWQWDLKKYLKISKKKATTTDAYKNYQLTVN